MEEAIEIYQRALKVAPEDFEITFNLANCFRQLGSNNQAEEFYRKAVDIKPEVREVYLSLNL